MQPADYPEHVRQRFLAKTDQSTGECWIWTASCTSHGYGQMWDPVARRRRDAHRIAYEMFVGPIPAALQIDHLCRMKRCVNPAHLEAVTQAENNRRSLSPTAENARKTHCINGHELTPENVYVPPGRRGRQCRRCQYLRNLESKRRGA